MAKRPEPKHKTPAEVLQDVKAGYDEAMSLGATEAQRYLEKTLSAQHSLPNAVKFFAYDFLVEACYATGDETRCLEAVDLAKQYLEAAQTDAGRELADYLPQVKFLERGIGLQADHNEIEAALALCDLAIELGLGRVYESKRRSLERRL